MQPFFHSAETDLTTLPTGRFSYEPAQSKLGRSGLGPLLCFWRWTGFSPAGISEVLARSSTPRSIRNP
jgi:hypothetical protein